MAPDFACVIIADVDAFVLVEGYRDSFFNDGDFNGGYVVARASYQPVRAGGTQDLLIIGELRFGEQKKGLVFF